ncbi:hypothetical protein J2X65_001711 [Ancylobacter sp. 3268]|uniref:hypothetical protein n=1 Tax=Ancylobacter sp. 3268 TaxID=2817752 RepID=UPI002858FAD4|nr:hypothetical protein [Ancylobacter sp. 3268]MDR6952356.1 hypothetical protein [Ancylobacter sp. 3268]
MDKPAPSRYLVDENLIEAEHEKMISSDVHAMEIIKFINLSLDFIDKSIIYDNNSSKNHVDLLRLSVRIFNSSAATLRLIRCGYWQASFTLIRDVIETSSLLLLLSEDSESLNEWVSLEEKERKQKYGAVKVRMRLEQLGNKSAKRIRDAYNALSLYAAHPTPEGFHVNTINGITQRGPFVDQIKLNASIEEIAIRLLDAVYIVDTLIESNDHEYMEYRKKYIKYAKKWEDRYPSNG